MTAANTTSVFASVKDYVAAINGTISGDSSSRPDGGNRADIHSTMSRELLGQWPQTQTTSVHGKHFTRSNLLAQSMQISETRQSTAKSPDSVHLALPRTDTPTRNRTLDLTQSMSTVRRSRRTIPAPDQLRTIEDTRAVRTWGGFGYNRKSVSYNGRQTFSHKSCVLGKTAGRTSNGHNLIKCRYLPDNDKKASGWSRFVTSDVCDEGEVDLCDDDEPENVISDHSARLVECGLSTRLVECGLSSRLVECGLSSRLVECGLSTRLVECGLSTRLVECGLSSRLVECGLSSRRV
ncbi:hypothetical protein LSAT2_032403, partial [Lamellibrachia satsuma]